MTRTSDIEKACEAAKSHELLTTRILRFCKAAKAFGIETENAEFDGFDSICFGADRPVNLKRGVCMFYVSITPGASRCPALRLGKLRTPYGDTYFPEKRWSHPTDEAFTELLELLTTQLASL